MFYAENILGRVKEVHLSDVVLVTEIEQNNYLDHRLD